MIELDEYPSKQNGLDLTPMIDVVFLLLIFFLLTLTFSKPSIPLNLPESESAGIMEKQEMSVSIEKDGSIRLNGHMVSLSEFFSALQEIYRQTKNKSLSLLSDKGVDFGRVIEVIDLARKAGFENISVLTEKKR